MKNTFGNNIALTIFGESHGPAVGAVLDGLAPGIEINTECIGKQMNLRRPAGSFSTGRREEDEVEFLSGIFNGRTTGSPICAVIKNADTRSKDYEKTRFLPRPSHADYTAFVKYGGFEDYRGGGHFSGRVTAPVVALGAVVISALSKKGIKIGTHIKSLGGINDREFGDLNADIDILGDKLFPALDEKAEKAMTSLMEKTAAQGDSIGGILETVITGLPAGLGNPWFDSAESMLAHGLFSVPGIKGVEFGLGFGFADKKGSEANDPLRAEKGKIITESNNNGGINGGITNGMPVIFRVCVKPTPSIFKTQKTVNTATGENGEITIQGRHDSAIIHRARPVVDSIAAFVIADLLTGRYGENYLGE